MFRLQVSRAIQRASPRFLLQQRAYTTGGHIGPNFYVTELKKRFSGVFLWAGTLTLLLGWPAAFYIYHKKVNALPEL